VSIAFLFLLVLHTAVSVVKHRGQAGDEGRRELPRKLLIASQFALFVLAIVFAYRSDAFSRDLFSPVAIGVGLLAGHLIFGFSLLVIYRSIEDAFSYFFDFGAIWDFVIEHPYVLSRFILVGVSEEIVWRAAGQPIVVDFALGASFLNEGQAGVLGVCIIAVAFAVVHDHFFRNSLIVSLEFLGFALVLGVLYYFTGSLILVIIVHAMRDIEICYLEYLVKVQELGDEEQAAASIESTYSRTYREGHE